MSSKYETGLDLSNRNDSHTLIVELTGRDKRVLDVGTATGYLAAALAERGCEVTGIEIDPEAARQADEYCEKVVVGDVESLDLEAELGEDLFDVIVFGDVLEHLKNPLETLKRFKPFLHPEGYVVSSIPNVAHGSVRLALLQGEFQYRNLGLLDDTHLRFFTRESVERLFADAGLIVGALERTRRGIFDTEVAVERDLFTPETLKMVQSDPEAQTYQFVLTAHPASEAGTVSRLSESVRALSEQLARKEEETRELQEQLGELKRLRQQLSNREEQLAHREATVHELNRELRNMRELQRRLDVRTAELDERKQEVARLTQEVSGRNHRLANNEKVIKQLNAQLAKLQKK